MAVFRGSRYEGVKFTGILGADGKVRKFLHAREPLRIDAQTEPIAVISMQRGDQLDAVAHRAAGKPNLWYVLGDVNGVIFPLDLDPGTEIAVPMRLLRDLREPGR